MFRLQGIEEAVARSQLNYKYYKFADLRMMYPFVKDG